MLCREVGTRAPGQSLEVDIGVDMVPLEFSCQRYACGGLAHTHSAQNYNMG